MSSRNTYPETPACPFTLRVLISMNTRQKLLSVLSALVLIALTLIAITFTVCDSSGYLKHPSDPLYRGTIKVTNIPVWNETLQVDDPADTVRSWRFNSDEGKLPNATIIDPLLVPFDEVPTGYITLPTDPAALTPLNRDFDDDLFRFTCTTSVDRLRFIVPHLKVANSRLPVFWHTISLAGLGHLDISLSLEAADQLIAEAEARQSDTITFVAIGSPDPTFHHPVVRAIRAYVSVFPIPVENVVTMTILFALVLAITVIRLWRSTIYDTARWFYACTQLDAEEDVFGHG